MKVHIPTECTNVEAARGSFDSNKSYQECVDMLCAIGWREADALEVYTSIFPNLYPAAQFGLFKDYSHPQPIFMSEYTDDEKRKYPPSKEDGTDSRMHYHFMFSDTLEETIDNYVIDYGTCLCSGCIYRGNHNSFNNAQQLCALIIDVDCVGTPELRNILEFITYAPSDPRAIPYPSLIALSGAGLHLYYILDQPIELYETAKKQLRRLKYALENRISVFGLTSQKPVPDHLPLNQSFRMINSINKKHGNTVLAFTDSREIPHITIDTLNSYVDSNNRVASGNPFTSSKYTKEEARELFPDWYQRVIVEGQSGSSGARWIHGDGLYRWWIAQAEKAVPGHRYYYFVCLAAYACKAKIPKDRFIDDCWRLYPQIAAIRHIDSSTGKEDPLTKKDVECAIKAYDKDYYKMSINTIERLSGITIPHRRNRPDALSHSEAAQIARKKLEEANAAQGKALQGRPSKGQIVVDWCRNHPEGRKSQCIKETGFDKKTVYKWWVTNREAFEM